MPAEFVKEGPPPGAISRRKLDRLRRLLDRALEQLGPQLALESLAGAIRRAAEARRDGPASSCGNCGHLPGESRFTWIDPDGPPISMPGLSVVFAARGSGAWLVECPDCHALFLKSHASCGPDFAPTGQEMGNQVTLRRLSGDEALSFARRAFGAISMAPFDD